MVELEVKLAPVLLTQSLGPYRIFQNLIENLVIVH
jgi:hypothetical protein